MAQKTVWFWKGSQLTDKWSKVETFCSDLYPKPYTVCSKTRPTEEEPLLSAEVDSESNLVVTFADEEFSFSSELWFALEEKTFPTDMYALHAVRGNHMPAGTVIEANKINFRVDKKDIIGFVQWFKSDSRLQQIYVDPNWRRRKISTILIYVADITIVSGSMGKYLNGGDITTDDGERLREAWTGSTRVTPRVGSVKKY